MEWISNWIQGIIIAVIIGTIIEMVLPEGNCKKYVKVVIGIYILFSIISPVITNITGKQIRATDIFDIEEYIEASSKTYRQDVSNNQQNQIKLIYINNLKNDIKQKIEQKGYSANNIDVQVEDNEEYTLKSISLNVSKEENLKKENSNITNQIEAVEKVDIQIENNQTIENSAGIKKEQSGISEKDKKELKKYISSLYNLEEENINIY